MTNTPDEYQWLRDRYEQFLTTRWASGVLEWDQHVTMPSGGSSVRGKQLGTLSTLSTEAITTEQFGERLDALTDADLSDEQRAVTREMRREHERATSVPSEVEERLAAATADAQPALAEATETDDFSVFEPHLEAVVEAKREVAHALDADVEPYAALVGDIAPQLDYATVERILDRVRDGLAPLLADIRASDTTLETEALHGEYAADIQFEAAHDLLDAFGFDWEHGRLDTHDQPFTLGLPTDIRLCTWTDRSLYQTLYTTAHEGGHALYAQGLPADEFGSPLGEDRGIVVNESQAAFWENHVFARHGFWEGYLPTIEDSVPGLDVSPQAAYESVNYVREDNPEWVEADELTGQLHVLLRVGVERDLVNGDIAVGELPSVWRDRSEALLGVRPDSLATGCLQHTSWAHGNLGYFPTYVLGNVLAAQTARALERDLGSLDALLRDGEFEAIRRWQREHVHRHGQRYTTPELVERVTGSSLGADAFLDYTREKYADIYEI